MTTMPNILVLAAGQSSRMRGRDKLLEKIDGEPLLHRTVRQAVGTGARVFVTVPWDNYARGEAIAELPVVQIVVPDSDDGLSESLKTGVEAMPDGPVMVLLGDLPELTSNDLKLVAQSIIDHPDAVAWRGATAQGKAGHPVVLSSDLRPSVSDLTGDEGAGKLLRGLGDQVVLVPLPDRRALTDLDTPEDWAAWRAAQG